VPPIYGYMGGRQISSDMGFFGRWSERSNLSIWSINYYRYRYLRDKYPSAKILPREL